MKGKIDKYGFLNIFRKDDYKVCDCPYSTANDNVMHCGDWCPLFGEPWEEERFVDDGFQDTVKTGRTEIELCKRDLQFDEFEDER
jgi:hypothetical protein